MMNFIHVLCRISYYGLGLFYPIYQTYRCASEFRNAQEDYEVTVKFAKLQERRARSGKNVNDDVVVDTSQRHEQLWMEQQEEMLFKHKKWLSYWIVFSLICVFQYFTEQFLSEWVPLYFELRFGLILFLILDKTHGCIIFYEKLIEPFFQFRGLEKEIDSTLSIVQIQVYEKLLSQLGGVKDLGIAGLFTAFDKVRQLSATIQEKSKQT